MATTFNYYIRPNKKNDGTSAVTIRVTHNRRNKYLPTSIYVDRTQVSRDGKTIRDINVLEKIDDKIRELRRALLQVKFPELLSVDDLAKLLIDMTSSKEPGVFRLDVFEYAETMMARMEPKTADGYRTALNAVRRFTRKNRLDINEITTSWVMRFRNFLETEPPVVGKTNTIYGQKSRGSRAVSYYLGCIRHIHNEARMEFNDEDTGELRIPRQPFAHKDIVPPMPITEHRTCTVDEIRAIIATQPEPGTRAELGRDVFVLSFALAGTNTIDLYNARITDLDGDLFTYNRAKTDSLRSDKAKITLRMLPIAFEIMERHKGRGANLFNFCQRYTNSHELCRACNKGLKEVAKMAGIEKPLTTYYARHSWGTIARNTVGIDFDTVNAALNHARSGNDRIADIYIAKNFSAFWRAQEAVMDAIMENKGNLEISSAI